MRFAVRALARGAGSRLLLFAMVDDQAHAVARADLAEAGRVGRALRLSLGALSPEALALAREAPLAGPADARTVRMWVALELAVAAAGPRPAVPVAQHGSSRGRRPGPAGAGAW